jgi:DNA repair exonuclease SbcCD ATPase subunit
VLNESRARLEASLEQWQARRRLEASLVEVSNRSEEQGERAAALSDKAAAVVTGVGQEHCDRCGQVLDADAATRAAESYLAERETAAAAYLELCERRDEIAAELASTPADEPDETVLTSIYDEIRLAQEAKSRLAALDEAAARREAAALELGEMRAELPTRDRVAADAFAELEALGPRDPDQGRSEREEVQRLEREEEALRGEIEQAVRERSRADERLERIAAIEEEANARRASVEKTQVELGLRVAMERACSANGIPALILESIAIPQVEVEATRLLRALGGPATAVELRTQRETKTAGIADTLDIVLLTDTGEANYETFSGGEKARIAFALRLALAQLLAARKGSDTGLLVIDEIDGLDAEGIAALVAVLEELPQSVPRIIVVSHDMNLRDAFSQSLTIENVDGHSRILEPVAV